MASPTFLDALIDRLSTRAARSQAEMAPAAVLWPDESRQWEPLVSALGERLPIVTLGEYAPANNTGPAYWVRCFIDGVIGDRAGSDAIPVVYLPGYARTDIRAVEDADDKLKPLAELLYRGATFAQENGRDWTLIAFLESKTQGLGIDVADDQATKDAVLRARLELAAASVEELRKSAPLKAAFFDGLMSPDSEKDVLRWLDNRVAFEASYGADRLEAFKSQFAERFGAELAEGEIALARRLGVGGSNWDKVWARFSEVPAKYPHVADLLAEARPDRAGAKGTLFEGAWGRWPQDNEEDEGRLRSALVKLKDAGQPVARDQLIRLETEHGPRREWVWATLGQAPLAFAIARLFRLADATRSVDASKSPADAMDAYASSGWLADDAVVRALEAVKTEADRGAVTAAIVAAYRPWLEETAKRFQGLVGQEAGDYVVQPLAEWPAGTCIVFFDGFRLDVARRAEANLISLKREVTVETRLTALPTITSSAKPAVSPVADQLKPGKSFAPSVAEGGVDLTVVGLRKLLSESSYQVLGLPDSGDPGGRAWTELGDLDEIGHLEPWNLPQQVGREVEKLTERVCVLLDAGWKQVVVVTDHGWLFLPGGLPKVDFPVSVTKEDRGRKGRTARLADGAQAPGATVAWYWDPSVRMAVAPDISTFVAGAVYEHGGISPQECVTPVLTVRNPAVAAGQVKIEVTWAGLRARISVTSAPTGATADLRHKPGDPGTSLIGGPRSIECDGIVSVLVPDEDAEGSSAWAVVLGDDGALLAQIEVRVGGG